MKANEHTEPIMVYTPEDIEKLPVRTSIQFKCRHCGKMVTKLLFKRRAYANAKRLLCKTCMYEDTCNRRYGVSNAMKSPKIVEKLKQSNYEKYGTTCTLNTKENIEKKQATWMKNFGAINPYQKKDVKEKVMSNSIKKYGVPYAIASKEVQRIAYKSKLKKGAKSFRHLSRYYLDSLYFDSSWEIYFYIWHRDYGCKIERNRHYFDYEFENKTHRTYVDFTVDDCFLFEIKAPFLLYKDGQQIARNNMLMYEQNVIFITDIQQYKQYVEDKYGKNYIKQFKVKKK